VIRSTLNIIAIKKIRIIKKILIWEGPSPSSISELINNKSKNPNVTLILILVFCENPKFKYYRPKNGENTRLRRTDK
jgi:hypothetical protein